MFSVTPTDTLKIASFDCALKNFAWVELTIAIDRLLTIKKIISSLYQLLEDGNLTEVSRLLFQIEDHIANIFTLDFDLCDLTVGPLPCANLPNTMNKRSGDIWLIERQPGKLGKYGNNDALIVSHQVEYHCGSIGYQPIFMSPKLKNNIIFHPSCARNIKDYKQRKAQSVANFNWFCDKIGIKINKRLPKKLDDIADAFIQIFAWFKYKLPLEE